MITIICVALALAYLNLGWCRKDIFLGFYLRQLNLLGPGTLACIAGVPVLGEQKAAAGEGEEGREHLPARSSAPFPLPVFQPLQVHLIWSPALLYCPLSCQIFSLAFSLSW